MYELLPVILYWQITVSGDIPFTLYGMVAVMMACAIANILIWINIVPQAMQTCSYSKVHKRWIWKIRCHNTLWATPTWPPVYEKKTDTNNNANTFVRFVCRVDLCEIECVPVPGPCCSVVDADRSSLSQSPIRMSRTKVEVNRRRRPIFDGPLHLVASLQTPSLSPAGFLRSVRRRLLLFCSQTCNVRSPWPDYASGVLLSPWPSPSIASQRKSFFVLTTSPLTDWVNLLRTCFSLEPLAS